VEEFFGTEPYVALNPMEVVALGAGVQAGILAGARRDVLLLDIVPLSLGIETMGGAAAKMIMKGSHIPAQARDLFSTSVEGQTQVKIHVVQGERELVKDCRSLGEFILSDIPVMPAGIPRIQVTFLIDANGILNVYALEERSGREASIQIVPSYGLTREEVSKMVHDSVTHARSDMLEHRLIDLRNQVRMDIAAIEKSLQIAGPQLDGDYRREMQEAIAALRAVENTQDADAIHKALMEMDHKSARLGEIALARTLRDVVEG
jgi:molecular chaperone DnaK (HSP70)